MTSGQETASTTPDYGLLYPDEFAELLAGPGAHEIPTEAIELFKGCSSAAEFLGIVREKCTEMDSAYPCGTLGRRCGATLTAINIINFANQRGIVPREVTRSINPLNQILNDDLLAPHL